MPSLVNVTVRQVFNNSACLQQAFLLDAMFSEINQKIRCRKLKEGFRKRTSATDNPPCSPNSGVLCTRNSDTICLISRYSLSTTAGATAESKHKYSLLRDSTRGAFDLIGTYTKLRAHFASLCQLQARRPRTSEHAKLLEFYVPSQPDSPAAHVITVVKAKHLSV